MSALPPLSNLDPRTQAFPVLTAAQIERIRPFGRERKVQPGEILFEPGEVRAGFFVLLSGAMEIVQPALDGERPIFRTDEYFHGRQGRRTSRLSP